MKFKVFILAIIGFALANCSSESTSTTASSTIDNPITNSYSTLKNKLAAVDFYDSQAASSSSISSMTAFGSKWNDTASAQWPDPSCSGSCSQISTKEMMGYEIDAQAVRDNGSVISVVGRAQGAMQIMCAMGVAFGSGSGYPADDTYTFSFTETIKSQMVAQCDFADAASVTTGTQMTIVIESPSNTTYYDKKATIDLTNLSGGTQIYYFRANSSNINVGTSESYTIDGLGRVSRTVVSYDIASDILAAEYVSGTNGTLDDPNVSDDTNYYAEFFRLFFDANNDNGYILSARGQDGTNSGTDFSNSQMLYALAGKPNTTGGKFSLSMSSQNLGGSPPYEACVNGQTGDIDTDNSRCGASATSIDGADVTTLAFLSSFLSGYNGADYVVSETSALGFDQESEVTTAAISKN